MSSFGVHITVLFLIVTGCQSNYAARQLSEFPADRMTYAGEPAYLKLTFKEDITKHIPEERIEVSVRPVEQYQYGTAFIGNIRELRKINFVGDQEYAIDVTVHEFSTRSPILESEDCDNQHAYYLSPGKNSIFLDLCPVASYKGPFSYKK